jgi:hypothetical protein
MEGIDPKSPHRQTALAMAALAVAFTRTLQEVEPDEEEVLVTLQRNVKIAHTQLLQTPDANKFPHVLMGNGACNSAVGSTYAPTNGHSAFWWPFAPYAVDGDQDNWDRQRDDYTERVLGVWREYASNLDDGNVRAKLLFTPVLPENPIRADSRDEGESAHHPARCWYSFSCLGPLSPTYSGRDVGWKSRTSFSAISSILL